MLQDEVHKLHLALNEERKVTEKLSRNLELEKRRSESLEQKAKNAFRKSGPGGSGGAAALFLPEEMRFRDENLQDAMNKYRDQLERLMQNLQVSVSFWLSLVSTTNNLDYVVHESKTKNTLFSINPKCLF